MKKLWIIIVIAILAIGGIYVSNTYNKLVKGQEEVARAWGQVENVYQRRSDLIPNLVAVVKQYTEYEQGTLIAVVEARSKATAMTLVADEMTDSQLQNFDNSQNELGNSLGRLFIRVEDYPDLKANEQYLTLHAQITGCENRILVERKRFNTAAKEYNKQVRVFPSNIIANIFGFEKRPYFEALPNAGQVSSF